MICFNHEVLLRYKQDVETYKSPYSRGFKFVVRMTYSYIGNKETVRSE